MLFGQVKVPGHVGKPIKIWKDVVLSDIHHLSISHPYQFAQNKSAWRARTCSTRTWPWLASVVILLIIMHCSMQHADCNSKGCCLCYASAQQVLHVTTAQPVLAASSDTVHVFSFVMWIDNKK